MQGSRLGRGERRLAHALWDFLRQAVKDRFSPRGWKPGTEKVVLILASPLDASTKVVVHSNQEILMDAGRPRKEGAVHDYLVHEMAKIRIDELRAEASRVRAAREARGPRGRRHHLGVLGGSWASRTEAGDFSRGMVEEACCA